MNQTFLRTATPDWAPGIKTRHVVIHTNVPIDLTLGAKEINSFLVATVVGRVSELLWDHLDPEHTICTCDHAGEEHWGDCRILQK